MRGRHCRGRGASGCGCGTHRPRPLSWRDQRAQIICVIPPGHLYRWRAAFHRLALPGSAWRDQRGRVRHGGHAGRPRQRRHGLRHAGRCWNGTGARIRTPFQFCDQAQGATIHRQVVVSGHGLADAHERSRALRQLGAQRKCEILFDLRRERLADRDHQFALPLAQRVEPMTQSEVARHNLQRRLRRAGQFAHGCRQQVVALGEQGRQRSLADRGEFKQICGQVSAIEHLACQRLLDVTHAGDVSLDDARAQSGHGPLAERTPSTHRHGNCPFAHRDVNESRS